MQVASIYLPNDSINATSSRMSNQINHTELCEWLTAVATQRDKQAFTHLFHFFSPKTVDKMLFVCYYKYIMLKQIKKGNTMTKENKYQIDTLLWDTEDNTHEAITFEVKAQDENDAWAQGDDYMNTNYNQELYNADTTITKVGA